MEKRVNIISTVFVLSLLAGISIADALTLDLDGSIVGKDPDNKKFFYHPDILGSTDLITNESGSIVEETTYEPHGEVIDGGQTSEFLYTSKELDDQTGLYYFGARYYDHVSTLSKESARSKQSLRGETE